MMHIKKGADIGNIYVLMLAAFYGRFTLRCIVHANIPFAYESDSPAIRTNSLYALS
jgi:hypothetical protein